MADTGWVLATAWTDLADKSDSAWVNLSNLAASDNSRASWTRGGKAGAITDTLKAYTYDLSVPSGATIDGIEVRAEARRVGSAGNIETVNVYDGDATAGTAKTPGEAITPADVLYDYGGASDLWGLTLTDTDVNDDEFQVRWALDNIALNDAVNIDALWIKVYYTEAVSVTANPAELTFTGAVAGFTVTMAATLGAALFTGADAELVHDQIVTADPSELTLSGADADFTEALSAEPGALQFTGSEAELTVNVNLTASPAAAQFTGASALFNQTQLAAAGALLFTGADASLPTSGDESVTASPNVLIFTGAEATLITPTIIRHGGTRLIFDDEERAEKVEELLEIVGPISRPLTTQLQPATRRPQMLRVSPKKQRRMDKLLKESGLTLEELLIIIG